MSKPTQQQPALILILPPAPAPRPENRRRSRCERETAERAERLREHIEQTEKERGRR